MNCFFSSASEEAIHRSEARVLRGESEGGKPSGFRAERCAVDDGKRSHALDVLGGSVSKFTSSFIFYLYIPQRGVWGERVLSDFSSAEWRRMTGSAPTRWTFLVVVFLTLHILL